MKREAGMADAPVFKSRVEKFENVVTDQVFPEAFVYRVNQIKIDVIGSKSLELGVEVFVHIGAAGDQPARQLGRQFNFVSQSALQCLTDKGFAFAGVRKTGAMVWVGGIDIVYAVVDCLMQHSRGQ